ncbi:MAG: NDP-hexose 2,3-dehydratase family protein [Rhodocyclales bacterium]|nr:NDP-hexose 2,3-dehydratase family protein [Rhodocyclales bacterium]
MPAENLGRVAVRDWIAELLLAEDFSLSRTPLAGSKEWSLQNGVIRHRTGRFFSVVGIRAIQHNGSAIEQPLLDQREIGTLALIVRRSAHAMEVLVQAKAEPGNVGIFQLAPSFQATASNTAQAHGGEPPPMAEWFADIRRGTLVADSLQSEQGTRFLGKRNRNCTLHVSGDVVHGLYHSWLPARDLCALLGQDYLLNTDLRSTLLCSDWDSLAMGKPFSGAGFAEKLLLSNRLVEDRAWEPLQGVLEELRRPAPWRSAPEMVSLGRLRGWRLTADGMEPETGRPFDVCHVQVRSLSREVKMWEQPIVQSAGCGNILLPMGYWNDAPHFLFQTVAEPGFGSRMELTPAITVEPGDMKDSGEFGDSLAKDGRVLISCLQSEEGGRFLFDENWYVIADVGPVMEPPQGYHWLSLAQIRELLRRGECFTNEARSALSLLLTWL